MKNIFWLQNPTLQVRNTQPTQRVNGYDQRRATATKKLPRQKLVPAVMRKNPDLEKLQEIQEQVSRERFKKTGPLAASFYLFRFFITVDSR